jgi:hypothetical protein
MSLRLPVQASVNRALPITPFTIPDPDGSPLNLVYGGYPGDPSPLLRPVPGGRARPSR